MDDAAEEGLIDTETADDLGLVTYAPDDIDWEDEIRIAVEERVNFLPMLSLEWRQPSIRWTRDDGNQNFRTTFCLAKLRFQRPNAVGPKGAHTLRKQTTEFNMMRT